jgi:repressor LexA
MSPRPFSQDLTPRQRRVLEAFRALTARLGRPPAVREAAADLDLAVSDTWRRLAALVRKGCLESGGGGFRLPGPAAVPVPVLGRAPAGVPREPLEVPDGYVAAPAAWGKHRDLFALTVTGDSMEGAGILDGDTVVCAKAETATDGQIVVALVDGETTIKRLGKAAGKPALLPANGKYKPIPVTQDSRVVARVVGVIRALAG